MDPERWRKIEGLFEAVLRLEPARRSAFLAEECSGDESLRREVESFLLHNDEAGRSLEPPARVKPLEAGQRIAHYKVIAKLGEGGAWIAMQSLVRASQKRASSAIYLDSGREVGITGQSLPVLVRGRVSVLPR